MYSLKIIFFFYIISSILNGEEICNSKIFKPRCERNGIIHVKEALYGRKDVDKCFLDEGKPSETNKKDPSFIGCYSDVRHIIEPQCAGKHSCDVLVASIEIAANCHRYLKQHLKVFYFCIKDNICFYRMFLEVFLLGFIKNKYFHSNSTRKNKCLNTRTLG